MRRTLAVLALSFLALPLLAADHVWLGGVSNRFSEPLNWSGGAPRPGEEEVNLSFPVEAEQFNVINDIPGLRVKSISSRAFYELSGQPMAMTDGIIDASNGGIKIWLDIAIEGTLTLASTFDAEFAGALSGNGGVKLEAAYATFSGTRSNSYRGETVLDNWSTLWLRKQGAVAIAGDVRTTSNGINRIRESEPEQIADAATVTLTAGELYLQHDETIHALRSGTTVYVEDFATPLPTLTVDALEPDSELNIRTNLRMRQSSITLPPEAFLRIDGEMSVPANAPFQIHGTGRISYDGSYSSPTLIDGVMAGLRIPNSAVEMTSGSFGGTARSLKASGGKIDRLESQTDIRLGPAVTLSFISELTLNGTLDLGGATLDVDPLPPGDTAPHIIIRNDSSQPVIGTFKGISEGGIALNRYRVSYRGGDGNDVTIAQLPKLEALISIVANPSPVIVGDPVTFIVAFGGDAGLPTGTITFTLSDGTELGKATIVNGKASLQTRLTSKKLDTVYARYSGDAVYASSGNIAVNVDLVYATAVVTSIDPAEGKAGTTVAVTIRGSGFSPGSIVFSSVPVLDMTFVSPSEMHATLDLRRKRETSSIFVVVYAPDGIVYSDPIPFTVRGIPQPPSPLTFDDAGTTAIFAATKGAKTAWISGDGDPRNTTNFLVDSDNDGIVRWVWPGGRVPEVMVGAVDLTAGTFAIRGRGNADLGAAVYPWPRQSFPRDASGTIRNFIIDGRSTWLVLWARPGVGAWRAVISDGSLEDGDDTNNGVIFASPAPFEPLGDSPAHPFSFAKGDIVIAYSRGFVAAPRPIYAGKLGDEIDEVVEGHISMAAVATPADESDNVARVHVIRTGGANNAASVHYRTINVTAFGGYEFTAVDDGVLTFAPGETFKTIEIPLKNDDAFAPLRMFNVLLFNPSGATIQGLDQTAVYLYDNDRPPQFDYAGPDVRTVIAADTPSHLDIPLTLTGASTQPVIVTWISIGLDQEQTGQVIFQPGESRKNLRIDIPNVANVIYIQFDAGSIPGRRYLEIDVERAPRLHIAPVSASEKSGAAHVVITLDKAFTERTEIYYETREGTATPGADYVETSSKVVFQPGQLQQSFDVPLVDDATLEGDETFSVVAYGVESDVLATVVIVDDELASRPRVSIDDHVSIGESDSVGSCNVIVHLSEASTRPITVQIATSDAAARGGYDYQQISDVITFEPGETSKSIPLTVFGDADHEPDETFFVTLGAAVNATLDAAKLRATITIIDDDPALPVRRRGSRH